MSILDLFRWKSKPTVGWREDLKVPLLANLAMVARNFKASQPSRNRLVALGPLLDGLRRLTVVIAGTPLESRELGALAEQMSTSAPALGRLRRRVSILQMKGLGSLAELLNLLTLWELRTLPAAESLLVAHRPDLERSIGALGECEAYLSLSGLLVDHDEFCLPTPEDGSPPAIHAEDVRHPLIPAPEVVRNPVSLGGDEAVRIITGSNMAGKSTYLRAVGVNLVLAGIGAPVCASAWCWTPLALYSDVNIRDSLDDGKSYFQVEVERVLEITREAGANPRILAIFDELFRGTNSEERLAIAAAVIRFLRDRGILLLVATHDSRLTELVTRDSEPGMTCWHFQDQMAAGRMTFDYTLCPGPVRNRNAIRVLEACDYAPEIIEDARLRCEPE